MNKELSEATNLNLGVHNVRELSDHNAITLDCTHSSDERSFSYIRQQVKDIQKINRNGRRVLYSLLK